MKPIILFLVLGFSLSLCSQKDEVAGKYHLKLGGGDHIDEYELSINEDGTFLFHSYRNFKYGIPTPYS